MTKLSPHAKATLDTLAEKHLSYTIAKATIEAELKNELEERVSSYRIERDVAMRLADEAGVPRTQLGKAIGTTNYRTVQEILNTANEGIPQVAQTSTKFSLNAIGDGSWGLSLHDVGAGSVSGYAVVKVLDGDLSLIEGDAFVIPQAYRNGLVQEVIGQITGE
jgi:hypothetical protein